MLFLKFICFCVFVSSDGFATKLGYRERNVDSKYSLVGPVHSRLRSVLQNTRIRRRKAKPGKSQNRKFSDASLIEDSNFYLPDSPQKRRKHLERVKEENSKEMPKIYITKLPVEKVIKKPEMVLEKQVTKGNETSAADMSNTDIDTIGDKNKYKVVLAEHTLHANDKDGEGIRRVFPELAIRSDQQYEDGLKNVNDMIYNAQVVNQPSNNVNIFIDKQLRENSTQYTSETGELDKNIIRLEEEYETDISMLGSADKIKPSLPVNRAIMSYFSDEAWALPIFVMASLTIMCLAMYELSILIKTMREKRRLDNLPLDHVLMASLLCCASMCIPYTLQPTPSICGAIRAGSGLACTLLFSTLLVRLILTIASNRGLHLHTAYQIIILSSSVLIQLVVLTHWLVVSPPFSTTGYPSTCSTAFVQQLQGHIYNFVLIAVLLILSLVFRREALIISINMVLSVIIWSTWIIAGYLLPTQYQDLCTSAGLLSTTIATFSAFFLPWDRQLSAAGKEDRAVLSIRAEACSPSVLSGDLSNISLFSVDKGEIIQS